MRAIKPPAARHSLGLLFFPAFDWEISSTHPERRERLLYTRDQIFEEGIMDIEGLEEYNPEIIKEDIVNLTHFCVPGAGDIVTEPHLVSAGGAVKAAELVQKQQVEKAFALIRPPGHHAFRVVHGARGFCTINNEAIMADWLLRQNPDCKLAFVDTDAHHADGTQDIFYHDPGVLHISLHQDGRTLFPGSGFVREAGGPAAYARTLNVPLPPGTGDSGFLYVMEELVRPVLKDFQPDILINAAGQDNHFTDPITNMNVTARGYGKINELLDPDLAVLQGGYAIESALPYVNLAVILAMAGLDYSRVVEPGLKGQQPEPAAEAEDSVKKTVEKLQQKWQNREEIITGDEFSRQGSFYRRQKSIHYDTDNIREKQEEKIKICDSCPGYIEIVSQASTGAFSSSRIKAYSLPHNCCEDCREEAREKYIESQERKNESVGYIYWQDRDRGNFERSANK